MSEHQLRVMKVLVSVLAVLVAAEVVLVTILVNATVSR